MDNLANFYSNILGIEITVLGIISAAIFVFLQILHSNFSYKVMMFSLKRISLVIYAVLSILVILVTSLGTLHFTMGAHDFIPQWNLYSFCFFESNYTVAVLFLFFLLSIALGIITIFQSIKLLNPSFLMRRHLEKAKNDLIKKSLHNRYGVPKPFPLVSILYATQGEDDKPEEKAAQEEEIKRKEEEFEKENKRYEQLKAASEKAPDIFEGFENLLVKAISQGNRGVVKKAISDFKDKFEAVLNDADESFPAKHLATYVGESLGIFLEACRKNDTMSFAPQFIRATREIALIFIKTGHREHVKEILKTWKEQADITIKKSDRLLFREIIKSYQEIASAVFEEEEHTKRGRCDILDDSFRNLGWLAERFLAEKGLEKMPTMHDDSYYDEFDAIYNAIFHFEWKYNHDKPDAYPLIFFDAIYVLFEQLLKIYTEPKKEGARTANNRSYIKNWLFSCAYAYSSFAKEAIEVSNGNGVALAGIRLRELYKKADEAEAEDVAIDIIGLIVRLAIQTAMNSEKLIGDSMFVGRITEELEKVILNSKYRNEISSAVFENFIEIYGGDPDKKYAYIKSLGVKLGTNFRLNFDASTCLDYPDDDPRRR